MQALGVLLVYYDKKLISKKGISACRQALIGIWLAPTFMF